MQPASHLAEITIKVPAPFAGVSDLGFSARYPDQPPFAPLKDVPLWIEGPPTAMRRLAGRLDMLAAMVEAAYAWTPPVMLSEEVAIMAFRDRSQQNLVTEGAAGPLAYVLHLVRPVVFPFLQDCAQVAHLRLTDHIEMSVHGSDRPVAELVVRREEIVSENGADYLLAS